MVAAIKGGGTPSDPLPIEFENGVRKGQSPFGVPKGAEPLWALCLYYMFMKSYTYNVRSVEFLTAGGHGSTRQRRTAHPKKR